MDRKDLRNYGEKLAVHYDLVHKLNLLSTRDNSNYRRKEDLEEIFVAIGLVMIEVGGQDLDCEKIAIEIIQRATGFVPVQRNMSMAVHTNALISEICKALAFKVKQ